MPSTASVGGLEITYDEMGNEISSFPVSTEEKTNIEKTDTPAPTPAPSNSPPSNTSPAPVATEDTVTTTPDPKPVITQAQAISYTPQTNPLHSYATYTYSLSLYILSKDDINTLSKNPAGWRPHNCLVSSGGKNVGTFVRNPAFTDDFYFDSLKITTVIGMNARSKSSNAIDISFTVIEPYGLTFLNRIMDASISVNSPNYIEMPYLLQIDFYGNDDAGQVLTPIPGQTKMIPIRIIGIKTKVGAKGSEYQFQAVPFNHQAFSESEASTPINLEVDAGTVGDFFKNTEEDIAKQKAAKDQARSDLILAQGLQVDDDGNPLDPSVRGLGGDPSKVAALQKSINSAYKSNSYTGGVNSWHKQCRDTKVSEYFSEIRFVLDPEIARSKITAPKRADIKKTPVPNPGTKEAQTINKKDAVGPDTNSASFAINSGTSVLRVIDMVMRNSEYISSQLTDPAKSTGKDAQQIANSQNKPLAWYKVVPEITLKEFDKKLNKWASILTYHIQKYIVYNSKHPWGPQSRPVGSVKKYDYMYTGKNSDVIDFNIDFDTLFYTAVQVNRNKYESIIGTQGKEESDTNNIPAKGGTNKFITQKFKPKADDPSSGGMQGNDSSVTKTATDIQNSLYSGSRGDMLNLKLKIIGDPQLIKQDDVYTNPANSDYASRVAQQVMNNGSLVMDKGELFAQVTFKTPVDIDNQTGLVRTNSKYSESVFSGIYKFLTVDNEFRGGKFEQTCDLIRMPDDIAGGPLVAIGQGNANKTTSPERSITNTPVVATEIINPPGLQRFDDGSSIQTFDDGSTLVTDSEGKITSTPQTDGTSNQSTPAQEEVKDLTKIVDLPGNGMDYNDFGIELNNTPDP